MSSINEVIFSLSLFLTGCSSASSPARLCCSPRARDWMRKPEAWLLKIARSTLYYRPAPVDPDDLAVMRRMDELYLASPFYGSRRMVAVLRREGLVINRKRVRRLMRVMGLEAIYQTSALTTIDPPLLIGIDPLTCFLPALSG
jgi:hypothetical protein